MALSPQVQNLQKKATKTPTAFLGRAHLPMLLVAAALVVYGLVVLFFVTQNSEAYSISRQIVGVCIGLVLLVFFWWLDYEKFADASTFLLILNVILLLSPHLPGIGRTAGGASSWVVIFGQQFQPGEIAKVVTILMMGSAVARYQGRIDSRGEYARVLMILFLPFICIMTQPDLGTGLVLLAIGFSILVVGGINKRLILISFLVLIGLVTAVLLIDPILDSIAGTDVFVKKYQIDRLLVFMDPSIDPKGIGYNLEQAKIAIGSGGFFGKGLGSATQSTLGFLPASPTDFIFATVVEQLGFVGSFLLFSLFGALFGIVLWMARRVNDLFGKLILAGVLGMWVFQVLENVGMCLGLMPVTGIPLPFFSYGSSAMFVNLASVGLISSVWMRHLRKENITISD